VLDYITLSMSSLHGFEIWRVATNALNKQSRTAEKGGRLAGGLKMGLTAVAVRKTYGLRPGTF